LIDSPRRIEKIRFDEELVMKICLRRVEFEMNLRGFMARDAPPITKFIKMRLILVI